MTDPIDNSTGEEDQRRRRYAAFWLAFGVFCLLGSGLIYFQRAGWMARPQEAAPPVVESPASESPAHESPADEPSAAESSPDEAPVAAVGSPPVVQKQRMKKLLRRWVFYSCLLLLLFMVAAFAIGRWSRSYRLLLMRRSAKPTPTPDVWRMHELPDQDVLGVDENEAG